MNRGRVYMNNIVEIGKDLISIVGEMIKVRSGHGGE